jgi:hypothetical protein
VGCLVHSHTHFFLGFEVNAILCPAKPVGREGLRLEALTPRTRVETDWRQGFPQPGSSKGWARSEQGLEVM